MLYHWAYTPYGSGIQFSLSYFELQEQILSWAQGADDKLNLKLYNF